MTKEQFQAEFQKIIGLLSGSKLSTYDSISKASGYFDALADKYSYTKDIVQGWYDGLTAPIAEKRDDIIKHLYEEARKEEQRSLVRQVIKDELRIKSKQYDGGMIMITVYLGDEVIDKVVFSK
jgi:hypothetical protein